MRTRVKICGITRREDAEAALALGADFLGLNFYAGSARRVEVSQAVALRRSIGDRARVVGVFVNHGAAEVAAIAREVGLDLLQFHGDEVPADLAPFGERAIKVLRVTGSSLPVAEMDRYARVWGFLLDSGGGGTGSYGGSGQAWDWAAASALPRDRPLFVAGGIRPDNVGELLARLSPWGIDVASGVESAPGRKDPALLERFFEEIAHAQAAGAT